MSSEIGNIEIWLIRHGETDWGKQGYYCGISDVPLNRNGVHQSELLAERLKREKIKFDLVFSSPFVRTKQTAEIISKTLNLEIRVIDFIKEINYGKWEGLSTQEIINNFSSTYKKWVNDPIKYSPPDGETGSSVLKRVKLFLNYLKEYSKNLKRNKVLVVGHNTFNRIFICNILGINPKYYRSSIVQDFTGINIIKANLNEQTFSIVRLNDIEHLHNNFNNLK